MEKPIEIPAVEPGCGFGEVHREFRCTCGQVVAQVRVEHETMHDANMVTLNVACPRCHRVTKIEIRSW